MGTEIPSLTWRINNTYSRGTYEFFSGDTFPLSLTLDPTLLDLTIMITSGSDSRIESTLNANVSNLRGTLIQCSSSGSQYESIVILFTSAKVLNL